MNEKPKETAIQGAAMLLVYVYLVGFFVSSIYYNWLFAKKAGFAAWLLFGQIVPTLQAIVWPWDFIQHLMK